ncbi:MAG: metal-dependent hydrolase [Candidatus Woesearchaeota archaeon]
MLGRTHALTGLLIGVLITRMIEQEPLLKIGAIAVTITGSLLPDIDSARSKFGRKVKPVGWFTKHRGIFHSLIFLLVLVVLLAPFTGSILLIAFTTGFLSHLLLDGLTRKGVTLLPHVLHIKGPFITGKFAEKALFIAELGVLAYIIVI